MSAVNLADAPCIDIDGPILPWKTEGGSRLRALRIVLTLGVLFADADLDIALGGDPVRLVIVGAAEPLRFGDGVRLYLDALRLVIGFALVQLHSDPSDGS